MEGLKEGGRDDWLDGLMDEWMNRWIDEWRIEGWTDGRME